MSEPASSPGFRERIGQIRARLVQRLETFHPGPRTFITAFCVGTTIGEYAALAGTTTPEAIMAAITALSAQLGVNLLADILGDRKPPPGLTVDEIAEAVQARLERGDDLPAVRALLQELDPLHAALEAWQRTDERLIQLVDELSRHPQLIAAQVTQDVVNALDPRLAGLAERLETLQRLMTQAWLEAPPSSLPRAAMDALAREYAAEVQRRYAVWRERYVALAGEVQVPPERSTSHPADPFQPREFELLWRDPAKPQAKPKREQYDDLRRALERHPHLVLLGDPGAGKTTTLWRLMFDYTHTTTDEAPPEVLPVLVPFGAYRGQDPLTFVREQLAAATEPADDEPDRERPLLAHRRLARHLEDLMAAGYRFAFLFDGLNEMPRSLFAKTISRLRDLRPRLVGHQWVLTCRQADYTERLPELAEATIAPLSPEQQRAFLRAYLPETGEALYEELDRHHRPLLELGRNPYLLRMIAAVCEQGGALPANRADLFTRFVNVLLARERDRWEKRYRGELTNHPWPGEVVPKALAELAYAMGRDGRWGATVERSFWENVLSSADAWHQPFHREDLLYVARSAGLVELDAEGGLRFTHQLLQEYFAAVHLNALGPDHPEVQECLRHDAWDEAVVLLAGLTPRLDALIERLLPLDPFLAARYAGVRPEALSPSVANRLIKALTRLAEDVYSPSREEAITALGVSRRREAIPALIWLLQDQNWDVRETAAAALEKLGLRDAFLAFAQLLRDEHSNIRWTTAQALQKLGRETIPYLVKSRLGKSELAREVAARTLGRHQTLLSYLIILSKIRTRLRLYGRGLITLEELINRGAIEAAEVLSYVDEVDPDLLITVLTSSRTPVERGSAALALGELGARKAIPALVAALQDEDWFVSKAVEQSLGKLWTREDIPALLQLLQDKHWRVRQAVAEALGKFGAREVLPELVEQLRDKQWIVRRAAAEALRKLETREAVPTLIRLLQDQDAEVRKAATEALGELRVREAVPTLIQRLRDEDWFVCWAAAQALEKLWTRNDIPVLTQLLQDQDAEVRRAAAKALGKLRAREILPTLIQRLQDDEEWFVREAAAEALGKLEAREAIPTLIQRLQDEDVGVREAAAEALEKLKAREAIPTLIQRLQDQDAEVRRVAAEALGKLKAREAILALIQRLQDEDWSVRRAASQTLEKLWTRNDIPVLIQLLQDQDAEVRRVAAEALGKLKAHEAILALIQRLQDEDVGVREAAAEALGKLEAREAIPTLIQRLQDEDWSVRRAASQTLEKLWTRNDIPVLIQLLQDQDAEVRRVAAEALGELKAREAIPTLTQLLQDENWSVRRAASQVLERLWTRDDIPILTQLLQDRDAEIRQAASQPLAALPPEAVLPVLCPLRACPDGPVRREVIRLYERARRNAGWPRGDEAAPRPYPIRAALWAVVTLTDETLALIPEWPLAVRHKAAALRRLGRAQAALKALEEAEGLEGASVSVNDRGRWAWSVERARCLVALDRSDEALTLVRQVAARVGHAPAILIDCADLLEKLNALKEAEALYTQVIDPEDWASHYRYQAGFYIRRGRYAEAEEDLAHAAEEEPWHPDTHGLQGQLMLAQGQFAKARPAFEQAARRDPHNVVWQYGIAFAYLGLGQTKESMAALEEALGRTELHEDVEEALQLLALLERARPELPDIAIARERILARKALLDQLAAQGD